ncbi:MAG TPA: GNAT family N-acetyltransferase [Acidimicrobiia bacterium]|nr:GNAT family N-acetyltransferase [Acidimicrobiia bacterium]
MTLRIETFTTEALDDARREAVIELNVAAHREEEFRQMFTKYIPSGGRHLLGFLGAQLVTHAVVTTRFAQPHGAPILRTAYVDGVSTHPDHERQGYGSASMRRLAASIDDYEIGCLQTDVRGFYEPLGWELWRGPLAGREDDGTVTPTPDQTGVMVLRLPNSPPLDLDGLLTIERQQYRIWE